MQHASIPQVVQLFGVGLLFHISFGLIMWVGFKLHYHLTLKRSEILVLPLMMHLFLYLMPVKGGMLFQVFYSKHKYGLDLSKGFSLGMMVFLNSLILTIILGLALIYLIPVDSTELKIAIWGMGLALAGFIVGINFLPSTGKSGSGFTTRLVNFLINVRVQLGEQIKNEKLFIGLATTTLISTLIQAFWFWKTAQVIDIQSSFPAVLLVVLVLRIILLIRFLPGNLGVQEVMIGVVFAAAGFQLEDGLLIGVITRLISVFWSATIGMPALYSNLHYFGSPSLSGLIDRIKRE